MSIVPPIEPMLVDPIVCCGLFCATVEVSGAGAGVIAGFEHGHGLDELHNLSGVSAAKAGEPNEIAAVGKNTRAEWIFMAKPHCTPRYKVAGIFKNRCC